jgi:RNA polymerase sigma-70 factor (sigma-E family)
MGSDPPEGFADFVSEHYPAVQRALALASGDPHGAEDATQEAFARALRHWDRVAAMERPVAWVYVVGANVVRRRARRDRARPAPPAAFVPDHIEHATTTVTIRAALETLTTRQRLVVVLRYLGDLSTAEVGEAMGCAPGTVKSTLHTALAKLRVELQEEDE